MVEEKTTALQCTNGKMLHCAVDSKERGKSNQKRKGEGVHLQRRKSAKTNALERGEQLKWVTICLSLSLSLYLANVAPSKLWPTLDVRRPHPHPLCDEHQFQSLCLLVFFVVMLFVCLFVHFQRTQGLLFPLCRLLSLWLFSSLKPLLLLPVMLLLNPTDDRRLCASCKATVIHLHHSYIVHACHIHYNTHNTTNNLHALTATVTHSSNIHTRRTIVTLTQQTYIRHSCTQQRMRDTTTTTPKTTTTRRNTHHRYTATIKRREQREKKATTHLRRDQQPPVVSAARDEPCQVLLGRV